MHDTCFFFSSLFLYILRSLSKWHNIFLHITPYTLLWHGGSHGNKHLTLCLLGQKTIFEATHDMLLRFSFFMLDLKLPLYQTAKPLSHRPFFALNWATAIQVKYSTVYSRVILWAKVVQVPSPSSLQYTRSLIRVILPLLPQKTGLREIKAESRCLMPSKNCFEACTQIHFLAPKCKQILNFTQVCTAIFQTSIRNHADLKTKITRQCN